MSEQIIEMVEIETLRNKVKYLANEGYRLVQIHCTKKEDFEVNYSFDKEYRLVNFRLHIKEGEELPSVSGVYWSAMLYENEMHDLFGIKVNDMAVDFGGHLYTTTIKTPFNS